jgi:citrate synthase
MKAGLEDVIAGESRICHIDGDAGILAYRGYDIHELAPLIGRSIPDLQPEFEKFAADLKAAAEAPSPA